MRRYKGQRGSYLTDSFYSSGRLLGTPTVKNLAIDIHQPLALAAIAVGNRLDRSSAAIESITDFGLPPTTIV